MKPSRFKQQTLALFFIISLVPALVVAAIWYLNVATGSPQLNLNISLFVIPIILLGLLPALILSFLFAELVSVPVKRIHDAILALANGNFSVHFQTRAAGDFQEIGKALDAVATKLKKTLDEAAEKTAEAVAEEKKLRAVLNTMTDGVFTLDGEGHIILFNKAASKLTGRTSESVLGQLAEKVMPFRQDGDLVMARWLATDGLQQKIGRWRGLELYRADGSSLQVNVEAIPVADDPSGIRALVTFHDVSASQELEQMK